MATQHLQAARKAVVACPVSCGTPPPSDMPRPGPHAATPGVSVLQPLRPGDERESERQTWFQNKANDVLKIPNGYLKVAVLIIRWDDEIDEFKGHDEEIDRLHSIFTQKFGYECEIAKITNSKKPQLDLNFAILQHVHKHDGQNNLLVVYYTGHGNQAEVNNRERLELSATTKRWVEKRGSYLPTAFWDDAEKPLLTLAEGDVLSILDCCFASSAAFKGRNEEFRIYQLLAASAPDSPTDGPGQNSFTKALCDSLEELLEESSGTNFTVTKLLEKINLRRRSQSAVLWDRLQHFNRFLQLSRLDFTQERSASFQHNDPEKASLVLRFSLKVDDLDRKKIEALAERLPVAFDETRIPVRRINWVKMEKANPEDEDRFHKVAKAMNTMRKAMRRKRDAKKNKIEMKVRGKKRTQAGEHLVSSKRQLRVRTSRSETTSSDTPPSSMNSSSPFE